MSRAAGAGAAIADPYRPFAAPPGERARADIA